jgi:hypothetical protein
MTGKLPRKDPDSSTPNLRNLISKGIAAVQSAGPVGWVAIVALAALVLAGFAINAIVVIVTTMKH